MTTDMSGGVVSRRDVGEQLRPLERFWVGPGRRPDDRPWTLELDLRPCTERF